MRAVAVGRLASFAMLVALALAGGRAAAETEIKLTLDFPFVGPAAPFLLPLDKGYYKAEDLRVSIDTAPGSLETIKAVAAGTADIGFAGFNSTIKYRDANPGAPVKAVFVVYNKPAFAIIGRRSRGISKPSDLEGKKLGAPSNDNSYAQWPIFAQVNGIDVSKVSIEPISMPVSEPMLAAGQVDAITGFSVWSYINLKDRGVPPGDLVVMLMADYGVELYGNAVIVNSKFADEHPDAVRGFLRALLKGMQDTVRNPAGALESVLKRNDGARKEIELERLTMAIRDNLLTPEVKANGYGAIDEERMARAIDQLTIAYKFRREKPKPADVFDASFLPSAASRRVN